MKIIDKNYGSIPHLPGSKLNQQADKKIYGGQVDILTSKPRDWRDLIIVTEKIDGSNVGIIKKGGRLYYITRSGYEATTSPYRQHHLFEQWAKSDSKLFEWLPEGYRICGEWCVMAHGTIYDITYESPFVAFDIIDNNQKRIPYIDFIKLCSAYGIPTVPLLHIGQPISIKNSIKLLGSGHYGNPEYPEGVVYRCEREGRVDFMAKYVREGKEDGKYMKQEIWNAGAEKVVEL